MAGFRCATCGKWHDELPMDVGCAEPDVLAGLNARDRSRQVVEQGDFRVWTIDAGTHYFVRGVIEIPVRETDDLFCYGVWTTLSRASYESARAAYAANGTGGPFFGWLSNRLPGYPDTIGLKTHVHVRADVRPAIELEPTEHPLSVEQRQGITLDRVAEIVAPLLHPQ